MVGIQFNWQLGHETKRIFTQQMGSDGTKTWCLGTDKYVSR